MGRVDVAPLFVRAPMGGSQSLGSGVTSCKLTAECFRPTIADPASVQPMKISVDCDDSIQLELLNAVLQSRHLQQSDGSTLTAGVSEVKADLQFPPQRSFRQMERLEQRSAPQRAQVSQQQQQQSHVRMSPQVWLMTKPEVTPQPPQKQSMRPAQESPSHHPWRWWASPDSDLVCPLTQFPIRLLPYPPFKLRLDANFSSGHCLVDGKFLAMQIIATGTYFAGGRDLTPSDVKALDDYIHRCKLGLFRPGRLASLSEKARNATSPAQREKAAQDLEKLRTCARQELRKLRRIQENRMAQTGRAKSPGNHARRRSDKTDSLPDAGASHTKPFLQGPAAGRQGEKALSACSNMSNASTMSGSSVESWDFGM